MQYQEIPELTRIEIENELKSQDTRRQITALLSAALYQPDREWVEDRCVRFLKSPSMDLKYAAIVSISHLARLHRQLNLERVIPLLDGVAAKEPDLAGDVAFTKAEIRIYIPNPIN